MKKGRRIYDLNKHVSIDLGSVTHIIGVPEEGYILIHFNNHIHRFETSYEDFQGWFDAIWLAWSEYHDGLQQ